MDPLLEVKNVTKVFKQAGKVRVALEDVSFERGRGCTAILGYNGSGKSTLLNLILGILIPDEGKILVEGKDPVDYPGVASSPLFPWYDPRMTVNDLIWALEMFFDAHVKDGYIKLLHLDEYLDVQLQKLSSGYQMRLQLLSTFVQPSRVILLDEITNGLDVKSVEVFINVINKIKEKRSILFATHIFDHAEAVADSVLVLHEGRLLFDGRRTEFIRRARSLVLVKGKSIPLGRRERDHNVIEVDDPEKDLPRLIEVITSKGGQIDEIDLIKPGFRSAFLEVLKDEGA